MKKWLMSLVATVLMCSERMCIGIDISSVFVGTVDVTLAGGNEGRLQSLIQCLTFPKVAAVLAACYFFFF